MKHNKGFTLIELLVVIAIIGILVSVVIASLSKTSTGSNGSTVVASDNLPEPTNYAVDTAGALTPVELDALNAQLKTMDNEKHQFAVLVVKTTGGMSIEEYGIKLAEKWKVGKAGLDNGAIIIVATEDRKIRIEVGSGLEGDVNDAKAGDIIRNDLAPKFKEGKWAEGITAGLNSLNNFVK